MKIKVLLAQNLEIAKKVNAQATVEAEYGKTVVKGKKQTLAHHVPEFRNNPAPCNQEVAVLNDGDTILVSHIDLDTLGGIMALMGMKEGNKDFWKAAEFIDLNGPHHIHKFPEFEDAFNAYWAFSQENRLGRFDDVEDITEFVMQHIEAVQSILDKDEKFIKEGKKWASQNENNTKNSLIDESEKVRIFAGPYFTASSYYSEKYESIASVTVSFNTKSKAITVATSDASIDCCQLMQGLFGPEAGGHAGIAGSPRGKEMSLDDLYKTVKEIESKI